MPDAPARSSERARALYGIDTPDMIAIRHDPKRDGRSVAGNGTIAQFCLPRLFQGQRAPEWLELGRASKRRPHSH
eukprot:5098050-Lingulodinium_polyedra.AAC.1